MTLTMRQGARLGVVIPLALFGFPLLALYAYMLLWWAPALTGSADDMCAAASCWRPEQRTFWILAAVAFVPAAACLVMALRRVLDARRWWPWPVAAVVFATTGMWVVSQI
ncbi:MAG: hypothetical protein ABW022_26175 [Actinoplanes sp.]